MVLLFWLKSVTLLFKYEHTTTLFFIMGWRPLEHYYISFFQSISPPPSLFSSHLAQNPFICDCNLKWLADYLRSNPIETSGARCASPRRLANKRIGQIKSKKFRCSGRPVSPSPTVSLWLCCSYLLSFSPLGVSSISAWFSIPHTTFNAWSFLAKGFSLPFICCAGTPQSISPRMNLVPRREQWLLVSPFALRVTTLWVWFHIQTAVSWDHRSSIRARVSVRANHSSALCQSQAPLPSNICPLHLPLPARRSLPVSLGFPSCPLILSLLCTAVSGPRHPHSLHLVLSTVFLHCTAMSGSQQCWGFKLGHGLIFFLDPLWKGVHVFFSFFSSLFQPCAFYFLHVSCHPSLATAKYLPSFNTVACVSV